MIAVSCSVTAIPAGTTIPDQPSEPALGRAVEPVAASVRTCGVGAYPGLVRHTCSRTDDGILVVDVWEDAASWRAMFADPDAVAGLQAAGVPEPSSVEILATHNRFRGPSFSAF